MKARNLKECVEELSREEGSNAKQQDPPASITEEEEEAVVVVGVIGQDGEDGEDTDDTHDEHDEDDDDTDEDNDADENGGDDDDNDVDKKEVPTEWLDSSSAAAASTEAKMATAHVTADESENRAVSAAASPVEQLVEVVESSDENDTPVRTDAVATTNASSPAEMDTNASKADTGEEAGGGGGEEKEKGSVLAAAPDSPARQANAHTNKSKNKSKDDSEARKSKKPLRKFFHRRQLSAVVSGSARHKYTLQQQQQQQQEERLSHETKADEKSERRERKEKERRERQERKERDRESKEKDRESKERQRSQRKKTRSHSFRGLPKSKSRSGLVRSTSEKSHSSLVVEATATAAPTPKNANSPSASPPPKHSKGKLSRRRLLNRSSTMSATMSNRVFASSAASSSYPASPFSRKRVKSNSALDDASLETQTDAKKKNKPKKSRQATKKASSKPKSKSDVLVVNSAEDEECASSTVDAQRQQRAALGEKDLSEVGRSSSAGSSSASITSKSSTSATSKGSISATSKSSARSSKKGKATRQETITLEELPSSPRSTIPQSQDDQSSKSGSIAAVSTRLRPTRERASTTGGARSKDALQPQPLFIADSAAFSGQETIDSARSSSTHASSALINSSASQSVVSPPAIGDAAGSTSPQSRRAVVRPSRSEDVSLVHQVKQSGTVGKGKDLAKIFGSAPVTAAPSGGGKRPKIELLREILDEPQNKICADCSSSPVTTASLNLGVLLCDRCARIHSEELESTVSYLVSLKDVNQSDSWLHKPFAREYLMFLRYRGNERANAFWEDSLTHATGSAFSRPTSTSDSTICKLWILSKYAEQRFCSDFCEQLRVRSESLWQRWQLFYVKLTGGYAHMMDAPSAALPLDIVPISGATVKLLPMPSSKEALDFQFQLIAENERYYVDASSYESALDWAFALQRRGAVLVWPERRHFHKKAISAASLSSLRPKRLAKHLKKGTDSSSRTKSSQTPLSTQPEKSLSTPLPTEFDSGVFLSPRDSEVSFEELLSRIATTQLDRLTDESCQLQHRIQDKRKLLARLRKEIDQETETLEQLVNEEKETDLSISFLARMRELFSEEELNVMEGFELLEAHWAHQQGSSTLLTPRAPIDFAAAPKLVHDENTGALLAGTFPALIEAITHPTNLDSQFVSEFLLTFETFCSPQELLEGLIQRYSISEEDIYRFYVRKKRSHRSRSDKQKLKPAAETNPSDPTEDKSSDSESGGAPHAARAGICSSKSADSLNTVCPADGEHQLSSDDEPSTAPPSLPDCATSEESDDPPPPLPPSTDCEVSKGKKRKPSKRLLHVGNSEIANLQLAIRLRVVNVFKTWITVFFEDWTQHPILLYRLAGWLHSSKETLQNSLSKQLRALILSKLTEKKPTTVSSLSRNAPLHPKEGFSDLFGIEPLEVARQISLADHELFRSISLRECLSCKWTKAEKDLIAPNVVAMIHRFNAISDWVTTTILKELTVKRRVKILERFISIAERLRELQNFNSLLAIVASLQSSPVYRLRTTWQAVDSKCKERYRMLQEEVSREGNFETYRNILLTTSPPCVPYLGLILTDITFITDGLPGFLPDGSVNFQQKKLLAQSLEAIAHLQKTSFPFEVLPAVQDFLNHQLESRLNETVCFNISQVIEPRNI